MKPIVVDAHQHFYDVRGGAYPYLPAQFESIYDCFDEHDLEPLLDAAGVNVTVVVQAMDSIDDTRAMQRIAARWPRVAGIVGWVPLDAPARAEKELDVLTRDARLVGIRHLTHEEGDLDWIRRDDVNAGLDLLVERDLSYDVIAVQPRHLEHVPWLAERHPGLRMVIDHLGKPPIKSAGWEPWATLLREAARAPNVFAKISGLDTAADWASWTADDLRPYVDHAFDVFGAERLMFGSDWPISRLAGGYARTWSAMNDLLADRPPEQRAAVLGGTAVRFYRLGGRVDVGAGAT